jgi:lysophospholipase L1-like esterase
MIPKGCGPGMKLRHVFISSVLALLLAEGALHVFFPLFFPDNYRVYEYDPAAGYRLKSSFHSLQTKDFQEEIVTNRLGTANFQQDFGGYKTLVFALGDSFPQGIGLPVDASYPFQVDLLLNLRDGRYEMDYGVVNLGVAGYGSQQAIVRLKEYAKKIGAPRYILFLACNNDVEDDQAFLSGAIHKKLLDGNPRYYSFLARPWMWLKFETEIGKRLTFLIRNRRRQQIIAQKMNQPQNDAELLEPSFRELVNFSQKTGATLILSWMPIKLSMQAPREYRWLQEFCRKESILFADWFPMVRTCQEKIPALPRENNHSAGHYRNWINSIIARSFAQHIH